MTVRAFEIAAAAALAVGFLHTGCGEPDAADPAIDASTQTLGDQQIVVPVADGTHDTVWIYAAAPRGPGPHPVVVYGHGQGADNLVGCTPGAVPADGDAVTGRRIVDALAAEGYLAVAVFYRNRDAGLADTGALRPRDHYALDARAFLAAAHWAQSHGGDARVALIGVSMGSFPALWAAAPLPALEDLQTGLDIVTSIPTAMLGNHIANTGRNAQLLASPDPEARAGAIALAAFASVGARAAIAGEPALAAPLPAALAAGLTPRGIDLVERAFLRVPDPQLAGCAAVTDAPSVCNPTCYASTFAALATRDGLDRVAPADWLGPEILDAIAYWDPPTATDPGAAPANGLLAAQRALSPAYVLPAATVARRILPLISAGDHVVAGQVMGGTQAADLYLARLRATSATVPDPVPVVQDTSCDHGDYLDAARPQCGWSIVLDELRTAFAP